MSSGITYYLIKLNQLLGVTNEAAKILETADDDLVGVIKGFSDEQEIQIIIGNLRSQLREAIAEVATDLDVTEDDFSDAELESIIGDSIRAQDVFTPFGAARDPLKVDEPIFERAKQLLLFRAISKNAKGLDFGGSVGPFGPPELPEELRQFNEKLDEAAADLKEAADRLTAGSEDIREAANALLGASPITIRDGGADTDTVIEFRPPGPHAEVVTVPLATAEVKAFIDEMDEAMRPIREGIDALFADMRATVDEVFGEVGADWRAFGDTAAGALRDILAAHGDMMSKLAQILSPLGNLVGDALGGGAAGGDGIEGGADSGGDPSSGARAPIRRYAEGGIAPAGLPALVGEEGPELFLPDIFDDLGAFSARRTIELNLKFTRNVDATGAAPGVEQGIHRVLDDFQKQFAQDLESEFRPLAQRLGLNLRVKAA